MNYLVRFFSSGNWSLFKTVSILVAFMSSLSCWAQPNLALTLPNDSNAWLHVGLMARSTNLNGTSMNLISSMVHNNVNGLQLSGLLNVSGGRMWGFQVSGLANYCGKNLRGMALSGLINASNRNLFGVSIAGVGTLVQHDAYGVALASLINTTGRLTSGAQLAGLSNITRDLKGVQFSVFTNLSTQCASGLQFAGATNIANRGDRLAQLGLTNICMAELKGAQIGAVNYAQQVNGVQIGVVNTADEHVKGVQLGLVNISADTTATKLGLVNIYPGHTRTQMLVFIGNTTKTNVAARFCNNKMYTIIGFGTHFLGLSKDFSGSLFYRSGIKWPLWKQLSLTGDGGFVHIESFHNNQTTTPERLYALQLRTGLEVQIRSKLSLFANTGYSWARHYNRSRMFQHKPIAEMGVILF